MRKLLPALVQCLPILWATGDATLTRFGAINWRTREFFSEPVAGFIAPFRRIPHDHCIDEDELALHAAVIAEWSGSSIKEE